MKSVRILGEGTIEEISQQSVTTLTWRSAAECSTAWKQRLEKLGCWLLKGGYFGRQDDEAEWRCRLASSDDWSLSV